MITDTPKKLTSKKEAIALAEKYRCAHRYTPLVLPVPTSKNNLRWHGRYRSGHTSDYSNFRQEVRHRFALWKKQNPTFEPFHGNRRLLVLTFDYQLVTEDATHDLANFSQALLDSLSGGKDKGRIVPPLAWYDDRPINLHLQIPDNLDDMIDPINPHCKLFLNPTKISVCSLKR